MDVIVRASLRKVARNDARASVQNSCFAQRFGARIRRGRLVHAARQSPRHRWPSGTSGTQRLRDHRARRGRCSDAHGTQSRGPRTGPRLSARSGSVLPNGSDAPCRRRRAVRASRSLASAGGPGAASASISRCRRPGHLRERRVQPGRAPGVHRRRKCRTRIAAEPSVRVLGARKPARALARRGHHPVRARHVPAASGFFRSGPVAARTCSKVRRCPEGLWRFLEAGATDWEAAVDGSHAADPAVPQAAEIDLRKLVGLPWCSPGAGCCGISTWAATTGQSRDHGPRTAPPSLPTTCIWISGCPSSGIGSDCGSWATALSTPSGSPCPERRPSSPEAMGTSLGVSPTAMGNFPESFGWCRSRAIPMLMRRPKDLTSCGTSMRRSR